ncbi:MAG: hypothetical protein J5929_09565 [Eubacterium sp.]|nr:hypothetical protein [Eubacterium sp.]
MKSIIIKDLKVCAECGTTENVEIHHCIHGTAGRKFATKYHLLIGLCSTHHRGSEGVHDNNNNNDLDLKYKRMAQEAFEKKYSHEKWMEEWGKNYL